MYSTTEFTGSGTRIAVTKCAASSITVILLSAVGLVRTCGTMDVCCAPAVTVRIASENQPKSKYPPAEPGALDCEPLEAAGRGR